MATTNLNLGKNITPDVVLFGDWDKARRLLINRGLQTAVLTGAKQGQLSAAKKIENLIKQNIRKNGPPGTYWPSYSPAYERRKAKMGGNVDTKWRHTQTYYNAITVMDNGLNVKVGVPKNVRGRVNPKRHLTLIQIATILERGSVTANIHARPLWRPTFKQFGGRARIATHITYHIQRNIFLITGLRSNSYKLSL